MRVKRYSKFTSAECDVYLMKPWSSDLASLSESHHITKTSCCHVGDPKWAALGPDLQFKAHWPRTQMSMTLSGEARGDNHPPESRPLMFIESSLMTHTSTSCIVMLGAVGVKANLFVIVWAVMCDADSHPEKHNIKSCCCERRTFPLNYSLFTD